MQITILANRDLPSNYALNLLTESLSGHSLSIFLSDRVGQQSTRASGLEDLEILRQTNPDLIITLRYGVILKNEVIAIPRYGVVNLHSGLLPAYKGVMATFRAMLAGETIIGTTLHYIKDASIDTGPVIGTTAMEVTPDKSYLWHVLNLYPAGCDLLTASVQAISGKGSADAVHQIPGGQYYSFPTDEDLHLFQRAGHRLFDVGEILEFASRYIPVRHPDHGS